MRQGGWEIENKQGIGGEEAHGIGGSQAGDGEGFGFLLRQTVSRDGLRSDGHICTG